MAKEEKTLSPEDKKRIEQEALKEWKGFGVAEGAFKDGAEYEHKYQREQHKALFEGQAIAWEDKVKDKNEQIEQLKTDVKRLTEENETLEMTEVRRLRSVVYNLNKLIASDSVYTLLRYGAKNPSSSGVDDCEEERLYYDLYNISCDLRKSKDL